MVGGWNIQGKEEENHLGSLKGGTKKEKVRSAIDFSLHKKKTNLQKTKVKLLSLIPLHGSGSLLFFFFLQRVACVRF